VARLIAEAPPPADHRGFHFYWRQIEPTDPLAAVLLGSPALAVAEALIAPGSLEVPVQAQVSLNIPPWKHRPGGPHIDGLTPPEPDGRPGTFTVLAGLFLTDQAEKDMGNLWVWPGTHRASAAHFRACGADALMSVVHYPPVALPPPRQVVGRAGDLLLAHYMLGHNMGGNLCGTTREVVYFRLHARGHRQHWRACLTDELYEFAPVRRAIADRA
jgi:hypothetical protein